MRNIYIITDTSKKPWCELHYASCPSSVEHFLRRCLEEENSGLDKDDMVQIHFDEIDTYFSKKAGLLEWDSIGNLIERGYESWHVPR